MCRFLAVHAAEPTSLRPWAVDDSYSITVQSRRDRSGDDHRDGWGIGWYTDDGPHLVRSIAAATDDPQFAAAATQAVARIGMVHVRNASVGSVCEENTHPFVHGPWMFCHNGTIEGFARLQPSFERETFPELRAARHGSTDSEHLFLWLLSNLVREGLIAGPQDGGSNGSRVDVNGIAVVVHESLRRILGWAAAAEVDPPTGLNLLLTDGRVLVAVRHGRTLSWKSVTAGTARPTIVIASEPTDDGGDWRELPPTGILTIDAYGRVTHRPH
jgi:predicted glutamine amidotransferase